MTTIVYRDGIIASDTLVTTANGMRCGTMDKIAKGREVMGGCAGPLNMSYAVLEWIRDNCDKKQPEFSSDMECILVKNNIGYYIDKGGFHVRIDCEYMAIGSGEEIAFGALAMGASAEEAVRIAIKFDIKSGGEVRTLKS